MIRSAEQLKKEVESFLKNNDFIYLNKYYNLKIRNLGSNNLYLRNVNKENEAIGTIGKGKNCFNNYNDFFDYLKNEIIILNNNLKIEKQEELLKNLIKENEEIKKENERLKILLKSFENIKEKQEKKTKI